MHAQTTPKKILALGNATIDLVLSLDDYPEEDAEIRAQTFAQRRGGNACNSLVILSQLGHLCSWAGLLAQSEQSRCIQADLDQYGITWRPLVQTVAGLPPTSYIWLNQRNGSRTIVHYRDLPEYSYERFSQLALADYDWIHFEGRNIPALMQMVRRSKKDHPQIPISIEIEKPRAGIASLFPLANILLFSKGYARHQGARNGEEFLHNIAPTLPEVRLFCAWGDQGGYACDGPGRTWHHPAHPPSQLIDTLAAGDVFNAGIIHALLQQQTTPQALATACRLAGKKCGISGLQLAQTAP